jgi:iron complex transport system substrate-binding protein
MIKQLGVTIVVAAVTSLVILAAGCGDSSAPVPPMGVGAPGIVDPSNLGWPRSVSSKRGIVEITNQPQAVLTPSLGHSEILAALVSSVRISGISKLSYDPDASNIVEFANTMPEKSATRDVEIILSLNPDLVIVSSFAMEEFVEQLETVGLTVVQTQFEDTLSGIADNVRLMAYMLGEVERGEVIVEDFQRRLTFIEDTIGLVPDSEKPGVMMLGYKSKWTGGSGTSNDDIIHHAGGVNLPAKAFDGFQEIGIEGIVDMNPEVLLLSADEVRENDAMAFMLGNPALSLVDAINNRQVFGLENKYLYNLSHWRIRGVEEVAKILYPNKFAGMQFEDFQIGFK